MYKNPSPTVDTVILDQDRIVLVKRKNEPYKGMWVFPGGFVDYGETVEKAALREVIEETGMKVELLDILGVYSDPERDPRKHIQSTVFIARPLEGEPTGGDDAAGAKWFDLDEVHNTITLAFDHDLMVRDLKEWIKKKGTYWSNKDRRESD
ncbi:MAG: Bifunctional NMN adenylyltransferase/Nudix hydrolase [Candidatus Thorarchaeota archaeon]|nr:MAG: Bifunctional NMN adenylyltransferase/Nudix hydrolase [Candidatus Thorarchaeota archaeon]